MGITYAVLETEIWTMDYGRASDNRAFQNGLRVICEQAASEKDGFRCSQRQ